MKKILLLLTVLWMLFILTACGSQQTSSRSAQNDEESTGSSEKENLLLSYYKTIELKEAMESSVNENVFKKNGYPDGYEFKLNRAAKEAVLVIRPISEKKYSILADEIQQNMEKVLTAEKYSEYTVKVMPLWNKTNRTSRQIQEEDITNDVVNEMKQLHQVDVIPGIHFSTTDGRIESLDLSFLANGAPITDPYQMNQYAKEFYRLAGEKGLKVGEISVYLSGDGHQDWKTKVMPAIDKGLKESGELQVTSTALLNETSPIIINTALNSAETTAKETGKRIEQLVHELLQDEKIKKTFAGPFTISVLGADGNIINE